MSTEIKEDREAVQDEAAVALVGTLKKFISRLDFNDLANVAANFCAAVMVGMNIPVEEAVEGFTTILKETHKVMDETLKSSE